MPRPPHAPPSPRTPGWTPYNPLLPTAQAPTYTGAGSGTLAFAGAGAPVLTVTGSGTGTLTFAGHGTALLPTIGAGTGVLTLTPSWATSVTPGGGSFKLRGGHLRDTSNLRSTYIAPPPSGVGHLTFHGTATPANTASGRLTFHATAIPHVTFIVGGTSHLAFTGSATEFSRPPDSRCLTVKRENRYYVVVFEDRYYEVAREGRYYQVGG